MLRLFDLRRDEWLFVIVNLHSNFSENFTLPAVRLLPNFSGIASKCKGIAFQLQWGCSEVQSIRYTERSRTGFPDTESETICLGGFMESTQRSAMAAATGS